MPKAARKADSRVLPSQSKHASLTESYCSRIKPVAGVVTGAEDGSAPFLGALSASSDITRAVFTLTSSDDLSAGFGVNRLLAGILHGEAALGFTRIGMEILADNRAAIALVEGKGCARKWTATVMTGPV